MARTNKDKEKDPVLAEIENDDTPIDDKGKVVAPIPEPNMDDLLAKNPSELTAADMDFLSGHKDDLSDEQKVAVGLLDEGAIEVKEPEVIEDVTPKIDDQPKPTETDEQRDQRYKAQQTEAQIQAERNKAYIDKVEEAANVKDPELDELKAFVKRDGSEWDELTNFEQAMAKRTYLSEKKFNIVHEAVQTTKNIDEWSNTVNDFIDKTDGQSEFVNLGGREADFRKFAMKESHRGTSLEVLASAFLYNLPPEKKDRGSLFNHGGGGEKEQAPKTGIVDADQAANLRRSDPREYKRQLKLGKIKLEV